MGKFASIDVALSAWSIFIQIMVNIPLFLLFLFSWLITKKRIFYTWSIAWCLNLCALASVLFVSHFYVNTHSPQQIFLYAVYGVLKVMFGIILLISAVQFSKKDEAIKIPFLFIFLMAVLLLIIFLFFPAIVIQFFVYFLVCLLFFGGVFFCFQKTNSVECKVVAVGFLFHGFMFFHHFLVLCSWFFVKKVPVFMSRISFFDSISEFILALTFFLGVIIRVLNEYRELNLKLEKNQENLRTLVDIDPLTGLKNRRVLRRFFEEIKGGKGCLAFIDVNKFKQINDNWGHEVGDKCLVSIALKMKEIFRVEDGLFRLGGDEFLIVCPGITEEEIIFRIEKLKESIRHSVKGIVIRVAVGIEKFKGDSHIDEVLKIADKKMYIDKKTD